jgi:hypothetical protein
MAPGPATGSAGLLARVGAARTPTGYRSRAPSRSSPGSTIRQEQRAARLAGATGPTAG